ATEEMVDTSFKVLTRLGLYKRHPVLNLDLFKEKSKGTIGGEGAAFFLFEDSIEKLLGGNGLSIADIDLVITGRNGDIRNDEIYDVLEKTLFKDSALANYKHLCGEYPVSSSFALWLAVNILKHKTAPPVVMERGAARLPEKLLIYNHYQQKYHSLMLVSAL